MVLGLLILTSIPTVTGVAQAYSGQKEHKKRAEDAKRMTKFHIDIHCDSTSPRTKELRGHRIVLKDGKVWVGPKEALNPCKEGYVAEAFYIEYPDPEREPVPLGLASQVSSDPPLLNWVRSPPQCSTRRHLEPSHNRVISRIAVAMVPHKFTDSL